MNFLVCSQAIIDLITSTFFVIYAFGKDLYPFRTPQHPVTGYLFCSFWNYGTIQFCLFSASTFNLVAISIERYCSILHPMWYCANFTNKTAAALGCVAWLLSPIVQLAFSLMLEKYHDGECQYEQQAHFGRALIGIVLFTWDFLLPCVIMGFCSIRICIVIIRQSRFQKQFAQLQRNQLDAKTSIALIKRRSRNVTVTFIAVVIAFILCWSTDHLSFLYINVTNDQNLPPALSHFSHAMVMLNSAINPFIYVLCLREYRNKLKGFLCTRK